MHSLMQVGGKVPDGSSRIGSLPDPRGNTSKRFFESSRSGDKYPLLKPLSSMKPRVRVRGNGHSSSLAGRIEASLNIELELDGDAGQVTTEGAAQLAESAVEGSACPVPAVTGI